MLPPFPGTLNGNGSGLGKDGLSKQKEKTERRGFLLGRILLAGRSANVLHDPLGRPFGGSGFLAHLHSSMVTMSEKSSLPQTLNLSHRHWWTHLQRGELDVLETGFKDHLDPMEGRMGGGTDVKRRSTV